MKRTNNVEEIITSERVELHRKLNWYVFTGDDKAKYVIPDTRVEFGHDLFGITKLNCRPIKFNDEVIAFNEQFILDPLMQLRYGKIMKYSEVPKDHLILAGNPQKTMEMKEEILGGKFE